MKSQQQQSIAEQADHQGFTHPEQIIGCGINADANKENRAGIEIAIGDGQQFDPDANQRHV